MYNFGHSPNDRIRDRSYVRDADGNPVRLTCHPRHPRRTRCNSGRSSPIYRLGVLPPFTGSDATRVAGRSPYVISLLELVDRFATSIARKEILEGYLSHREKLLSLGFTGHQWLDGSFTEDVESNSSRAPSDIDVISFILPPPNLIANPALQRDVIAANQDVFIPTRSKAIFKTDAYFVGADIAPASLIRQTAYWFGLFSHRRIDGVWKGMLEVELSTSHDTSTARALLGSR